MKRLVFIVEGDSEVVLVDNIIIPYLSSLGITPNMHAQTIITNRKQHKKGGVTSYGLFKNEVERTLAQGNVIVTTLIDFFRLPTDFPGYTSDSKQIEKIENGIRADFDNNSDFIPYIQRHEFESVLFSTIDGFDFVIDDEKQLEKVHEVINAYANPEDINSSPEGAPSKRLKAIFNYDKKGDSELILEMIGIEAILEKCPRFAEWIDKLIIKMKEV